MVRSSVGPRKRERHKRREGSCETTSRGILVEGVPDIQRRVDRNSHHGRVWWDIFGGIYLVWVRRKEGRRCEGQEERNGSGRMYDIQMSI